MMGDGPFRPSLEARFQIPCDELGALIVKPVAFLVPSVGLSSAALGGNRPCDSTLGEGKQSYFMNKVPFGIYNPYYIIKLSDCKVFSHFVLDGQKERRPILRGARPVGWYPVFILWMRALMTYKVSLIVRAFSGKEPCPMFVFPEVSTGLPVFYMC